MAINLAMTNLDMDDPNFRALYEDLQGNILTSHGRDHVAYLFIKFKADAEACKGWVRKMGERVTSVEAQFGHTKAHKESGKATLFTSLMLSVSGYKALGVEAEKIPGDKAFNAGMKDMETEFDVLPRADHAAVPNALNDDVSQWEAPFQQDLDGMVLLAYAGKNVDDRTAQAHLETQIEGLEPELKDVAEVVLVQRGQALRNEKGQVIEHFGFVDGVSNPRFMKADLAADFANGGFSRYDPSAPLNLVLSKDPGGGPNGYGAYIVFRKLQQNVKGFAGKLNELAMALSEASGKAVSPEYAGALAIGRFKDGTPISEQSQDGWTNLFNNFNFDDDTEGRRCPLHAHIRKTNPRGDTMRQFDAPQTIERSRRIVRRGISYGSTEMSPSKEWTDAGLLFMSAQADIEQQFFFQQNTWSNRDSFVRKGVGIDPVIGQPREGTSRVPQKWSTKWGTPGEPVEFQLNDVVRMRGGEYFFVPSISSLKAL